MQDSPAQSAMESAPVSAAPMRELTIRGLVLGVIITTLFTAANVYLGLKVGLTFATSIPARKAFRAASLKASSEESTS